MFCVQFLVMSSHFWAETTRNGPFLVVSFGNDYEQSGFFLFIRETRTAKSRFHNLW